MKSSSDNSFIPKRGASKRKQVAGSRPFYIFTYISYILMFAALLSSGGVYLYAQYIDSELAIEIKELNSEIGSFNQADMERVTEFNLRLAQAQDRLDNSVSIASVFDALEQATIDTVQIESLLIEREDDNQLLVEAIIQTDSFDSTIFQRGVYLRNNTIQDVEIQDVENTTLAETDLEVGAVAGADSTRPAVSFRALLGIPLETVPAKPQSYQFNQSRPVEPAMEISNQPTEQLIDESVQSEDVNEDNL
jgi:hypothetical protein